MKVICRVLRQTPDDPPRWAEYHAEVEEGATVLDLLRSISRQDPGLAYTAHHCKLGIARAAAWSSTAGKDWHAGPSCDLRRCNWSLFPGSRS
jgi:hypothetical protein